MDNLFSQTVIGIDERSLKSKSSVQADASNSGRKWENNVSKDEQMILVITRSENYPQIHPCESAFNMPSAIIPYFRSGLQLDSVLHVVSLQVHRDSQSMAMESR
jgi:hypothetical protein